MPRRPKHAAADAADAEPRRWSDADLRQRAAKALAEFEAAVKQLRETRARMAVVQREQARRLAADPSDR